MKPLEQVCADVKAASRVLAGLPGRHRDAALAEMAEALERRSAEILRENQKDVEAAKRAHAAPAMLDRLLLDENRLRGMAAGVREVAALPDPVGEIDGGWRAAERAARSRRARVPLGVIASSTRRGPT